VRLGFDNDVESPLPLVSILLVDDQPENLCALEASLEPVGQRLVCVSSGADALRAVLDNDFALILMDISMPELDGFDTVALIRERERSRHIPIIFLSAYPEQHHAMRSYSAGAVDYILKPFDPETLRSKVSVFVHLRQHELALHAAHAELEQRVLERTAELAAANIALEREIVERKAVEKRLFDQANHDGLTELANRDLLMTYLHRAVAQWRRQQTRRFAIMMIDLDRFKDVNDSLGHLAGDQLLRGVAQRLALCVREVDTVARLGGDEFAILVDGVAELKDVTSLAERIQHQLARPFVIDGKDVDASASIGIAMMKGSYRSADDILRDADSAMYSAKEAGRAGYRVFATGDRMP
jgi:diguanylate cyclase (GGDEF)-like protein